MIQKECEYCGQGFSTYPSFIALGRGRFCSTRCSYRAQKGIPRDSDYVPNSKKIVLTCLLCGKEFQRVPSEIARGANQFCSNACKFAWRGIVAQETYVCESCGEEYHSLPGDQHQRNGFYCSKECGQALRASWNIRFFDELDKEGAYILGFLIADGHIAKDGCTIVFTQKEPEILKRMAKVLGEPDGIKQQKGRPCYDLVCYSVYAAKVLNEKYGIPIGNKSYTVRMPTISDELYPHLVRGMFDGDGCVGQKGRLFSYCSGSPGLLEDLSTVLVEKAGLQPGRYHKDNSQNIYWSSWENAKKLAVYMYGSHLDVYSSSLYLERKKERFMLAFEPWKVRGYYRPGEVENILGVDRNHFFGIAKEFGIGQFSGRKGNQSRFSEQDVKKLIEVQQRLSGACRTTKSFAEKLGVSQDKVWGWVNKGLVGQKIMGQWYFFEEDEQKGQDLILKKRIFLTSAEVATRLGIYQNLVDYHAGQGRIGKKEEGHWYFCEEDVKELRRYLVATGLLSGSEREEKLSLEEVCKETGLDSSEVEKYAYGGKVGRLASLGAPWVFVREDVEWLNACL